VVVCCRCHTCQALTHTLTPPNSVPVAAAGAATKAGTWAPTVDDAKFIEMMADMEDKWPQGGTACLAASVGLILC